MKILFTTPEKSRHAVLYARKRRPSVDMTP